MTTATYPSASVVIPTYNRLSDLRSVLESTLSQEVPRGATFEVVIVDDGSSDGTWDWLRTQHGLVALSQDNAGPARARNRGAGAATGEVLLFLGDDTVPQSGWLAEHLEEHRLHGGDGPLAVLGYTSFPPEDDRPFLRFINEYGAQFGYALIDEPLDVPFNFFYTSNISLRRVDFVDQGGFREDFPAAAWEDIEFAYRAAADGMRIHYQPRARTQHHHRIRPRTFCHRQRTAGRSAAIFARLHPELGGFLGVELAKSVRWDWRLRRSLLLAVIELGERLPGSVPSRLYQSFLDLSYRAGLAESLQES